MRDTHRYIYIRFSSTLSPEFTSPGHPHYHRQERNTHPNLAVKYCNRVAVSNGCRKEIWEFVDNWMLLASVTWSHEAGNFSPPSSTFSLRTSCTLPHANPSAASTKRSGTPFWAFPRDVVITKGEEGRYKKDQSAGFSEGLVESFRSCENVSAGTSGAMPFAVLLRSCNPRRSRARRSP